MKPRFQVLASVGALTAVTVALWLAPSPRAQTTTAKTQTPLTAWGEPDLQGIWIDEFDTPMQRASEYAGREFLTEAERAALDERRSGIRRREYRDKDAQGKPTEQDVAGAYNTVYESHKRTSRRTSLVVDPPDGRIPLLTEEAQKRQQVYRAFRLALLQATLRVR